MRHPAERLAQARYPWVCEMETRFADLDPNRHLNNVAISRFFEETRVRFNWHIISAGAAIERPRYLVAHVSIDYLAQGQYPAPLRMAYGVLSIGNSSFRAGKAMFQHDRCLALCDSVLVHRGADGGPAPLPDLLRQRLEAHLFKGETI
jgi:acyl-CoA thioester hydrolase